MGIGGVETKISIRTDSDIRNRLGGLKGNSGLVGVLRYGSTSLPEVFIDKRRLDIYNTLLKVGEGVQPNLEIIFEDLNGLRLLAACDSADEQTIREEMQKMERGEATKPLTIFGKSFTGQLIADTS